MQAADSGELASLLIVSASIAAVVYQRAQPSKDLYADHFAGYRVGAAVGPQPGGLRTGPCHQGIRARYPKSIGSEGARNDTAVFMGGCIDGLTGNAPSACLTDCQCWVGQAVVHVRPRQR